MSPAERFLKHLARVDQVSSPADIFDLARQFHYDGAITFHLQGGTALRVEIGRPVQIAIVPLEVSPRRAAIDRILGERAQSL